MPPHVGGPEPVGYVGVFADELQAIGKGPRHRAVGQFVEHLRVAGGIQRIDKKLLSVAAESLADSISVSVINHGHRAVRQHVILEVAAALQTGAHSQDVLRLSPFLSGIKTTKSSADGGVIIGAGPYLMISSMVIKPSLLR